jgi:hypothetical protein
MLVQLIEDHLDMLQMFCPCGTIDQNIVKENQHKHANEGLHDLIHQRLKCGGCIREPKWHDGELEVALVCSERHFLNVFRMHSHLMYPLRRSIFVKNRAPRNWSNSSSTTEIRNLSLAVFSFNTR